MESHNPFLDGVGQVDQTCTVAEDFTKIYFENLDKKRLLLPKLYLDDAALVWNGNGFSGRDSIVEHLQQLPATHHTILSLDAQKVPAAAVDNKPAFVIQVFGFVQYEIFKNRRPFHQNFMIVADAENKWKIASDCLRIQECVPT